MEGVQTLVVEYLPVVILSKCTAPYNYFEDRYTSHEYLAIVLHPFL